ncbi:MAG: DegV family protein [Oscillospiraceae bacterium]
MKYGIVVDSGCDMAGLAHQAEAIDFSKVALKLDIGDREFIDDDHLDIKTFMDEMYAYKGKTGTAAPSPADWLTAFEKSECVFAITLSSAISGSYASAQVAMRMFLESYPERRIYLIDSKSAGPGQTIFARRLEELMRQNLDFEEIRGKINEYQYHTDVFFVLSSMENLIKNGRINRFTANLAGILGIKILGGATAEGKLELLAKCRGRRAAYDRAIAAMLERNYNGGKVIIAHCFNRELADYVAAEIRMKFHDCAIEIMDTGGLCSYYAERSGIIIGFEKG